jgi:hypothetical protein
MARSPCDLRLLLLAAAVAFIYIQVRLFATQSHYADRLAEAEKSENQCTSQLKSLIDQVSMQQEKIVALEGTNTSNLHLHMIFLDAKTQIKHVYEFTQIQYLQDTIDCYV